MSYVQGAARWFVRAIALAVFFSWELALANIRVAYEVLTPKHRMRPGIIAVSLATDSDLQTMLFANLITLTPGTLSLDVSDDRRTLYVHAMYVDDAHGTRMGLKRAFEQRIKDVIP